MKNNKLGILKVRDNFQSYRKIESTHEFEVGGELHAGHNCEIDSKR